MRVITISREFGSGGRELAKRLADLMQIDYYDKEIISKISENKGVNSNYVEHVLENHGWQEIPLTYGHSFLCVNPLFSVQVSLLKEQREVIEKIAKARKDFIIVGRNADVLLKEYNPFKIFVCAKTDAKVKRCLERAEPGENLSEKTVKKMIKRIDKNRARTHELISEAPWGDIHEYHLIVNTTNWSIKELAPLVKEYIEKYFAAQSKE